MKYNTEEINTIIDHLKELNECSKVGSNYHDAGYYKNGEIKYILSGICVALTVIITILKEKQ